MNLKTLIETLKVKLDPSFDYNLSKKSGKYIISKEEEMASSKAPKGATELISNVLTEMRDGFKRQEEFNDEVRSFMKRTDERLDVIEDKLERNNIN